MLDQLNELTKILFAMNMGIALILLLLLGFTNAQVKSAKYHLILLVMAVLLSLWNNYVSLSEGKLDDFKVGFLWAYFGWCLGPLLFGYVSLITKPDVKIIYWHHYWLPMLILTITIVVNVLSLKFSKPTEFILFYVMYLQILTYGTKSIIILLHHIKQVHFTLSDDQFQSLRWLLYLTGCYIFMWVIDMLTTTMNLMGIGPGIAVYQWYLWIESIFIIGMTIFAIKQPDLLYSQILVEDITYTKNIKYQTSLLDEQSSKLLMNQLDTLMIEQKPYLNAELNLTKLAQLLDVTTHQLSQLLNLGYQLNFYNYINLARIQESKELLLNSKFAHLDIIDIALQSGFNNKTTFNRSFRKYVGKTPSVFRQLKPLNE